MPYIMLQTNMELTKEDQGELLKRLSQKTADLLRKSEAYVMTALRDKTPMLFAGKDDPAAFLELKSIGLPEGDTPRLSAELCDFISNQLGIPKGRIYIEFCNAERHLWGWDGRTF